MSVFGLSKGACSTGMNPVLRVPATLVVWIMTLIEPPRRPATPSIDLPPFRKAALTCLLAFAVLLAMMAFVDPWIAVIVDLRTVWIERVSQRITSVGRTSLLLGPLGVTLVVLAAAMSPALSRMSQGVVAALAVRVGFAFLAIGVPGLFTAIIKRLVGRARPYASLRDDSFVFEPFIWDTDFASMPSGHATSAVAAALVIGWLWPRARVPAWLFAIVIGASRVVVTAHHVSDIFAGALVGAGGAFLVRQWFFARRLGFAAPPGGPIRAMPGPSMRRIKRVVGQLFGRKEAPAGRPPGPAAS